MEFLCLADMETAEDMNHYMRAELIINLGLTMGIDCRVNVASNTEPKNCVSVYVFACTCMHVYIYMCVCC